MLHALEHKIKCKTLNQLSQLAYISVHVPVTGDDSSRSRLLLLSWRNRYKIGNNMNFGQKIIKL